MVCSLFLIWCLFVCFSYVVCVCLALLLSLAFSLLFEQLTEFQELKDKYDTCSILLLEVQVYFLVDTLSPTSISQSSS